MLWQLLLKCREINERNQRKERRSLVPVPIPRRQLRMESTQSRWKPPAGPEPGQHAADP